MKIHELTVKSAKSIKRVGRGISAGGGKTAGRGTKGQNARTGGGVRLGFEGGQNPLAKRLPKRRGFRAINRVEYQEINLNHLEKLGKAKVDNSILAEAGLIRSNGRPVKILATGELSKKMQVSVDAATKSAIAAIEGAGGKFIKSVPAKAKATAKSE